MTNYKVRIDSFGDKFYYLNNLFHREDGPAIELANGYKEWYLNNNLHREDGPAIDYPNGTKKWYKNGLYHREDGPAVEWTDGTKEWYLNGKCCGYNNDFTNESWLRFVKTLIFS